MRDFKELSFVVNGYNKSTVRAFVAIDLPESVRSFLRVTIADLQRLGADVKWVRPESTHLTLKFLGDVDRDLIPEIDRLLAPCFAQCPPMRMEAKGLGTFPGAGRPRVIWAGIGDSGGKLGPLAAEVDRLLGTLGFEREKRPFSPHLTLGRVRSGSGLGQLSDDVRRKADLAGPGFTADIAVLFQSVLKPTGAQYTPPVQVPTFSMKIALQLSAAAVFLMLAAGPTDSAAEPVPAGAVSGSVERSAPAPTSAPEGPEESEEFELDAFAAQGDLVEGPRPYKPPEDPCLGALYQDWREYSRILKSNRPDTGFSRFRIILDRSEFRLTFEGVTRDGKAQTIYESPVGLGDFSSPTPAGGFLINHVYLYPDVLYFSPEGEKIPNLYNGLFAPLLVCDEKGRCERYRDLGIHGFRPAAYPDPASINPSTCGPVSSGCIRIPDPCGFKSSLVGMVGLGVVKRNDRGTYHWLQRPVEVIITDAPYAGDGQTLVGILEDGVSQVQKGLRSILDYFGQ